jgi:hypothetical protein
MNKFASRVRIEPESSISTFFSIIFGLVFLIFGIFIGAINISDYVFFGWFFILFGICFGGYVIAKAIQGRLAMRKFKKGSTTTTARVINYYVKTFSNPYGSDTHRYFVVIKFTAVEKEWTLEAMVSKNLYDRTKNLYGRTDNYKLSVIYADSDPRCALLEGEPKFERFV